MRRMTWRLLGLYFHNCRERDNQVVTRLFFKINVTRMTWWSLGYFSWWYWNYESMAVGLFFARCWNYNLVVVRLFLARYWNYDLLATMSFSCKSCAKDYLVINKLSFCDGWKMMISLLLNHFFKMVVIG